MRNFTYSKTFTFLGLLPITAFLTFIIFFSGTCLSASFAATSSDLLTFSDEQEKSLDIETWGWAKVFSAIDTDKINAEDNQLTRARARLGANWEEILPSGHTLRLKSSIEIDHIDYDSAQNDTDFALYETFFQFDSTNWDVSLGKQRVRWGKSDQLSPIDSINPQDLRQSIAMDLEERVIPSWLVRTRWHGESFNIETILQPWFEESKTEYFDSDWAIYRNIRQSILAHPAVPNNLKSYTQSITVKERKPANSLKNMSAGLRVHWQTDATDYAISYHYGWETLPTITSFPVSGIEYNGNPDTDPSELLSNINIISNIVEATFKRQKTLGFEWETVLDPIGFRGEIAYIDEVSFLADDLTSERKKVTQIVTGIDYTSETEWYFNLQGSWQHIHEYSDNLLFFKEDNLSVFGEISKPAFRGNLEIALGYSYMITDQSSYLQPSTTIKYIPNVEIELGAMVYSGEKDTILGSYDDADQLYGTVKISF